VFYHVNRFTALETLMDVRHYVAPNHHKQVLIARNWCKIDT